MNDPSSQYLTHSHQLEASIFLDSAMINVKAIEMEFSRVAFRSQTGGSGGGVRMFVLHAK